MGSYPILITIQRSRGSPQTAKPLDRPGTVLWEVRLLHVKQLARCCGTSGTRDMFSKFFLANFELHAESQKARKTAKKNAKKGFPSSSCVPTSKTFQEDPSWIQTTEIPDRWIEIHRNPASPRGWLKPLWIMGCLPPFSTGDADFFPQSVRTFRKYGWKKPQSWVVFMCQKTMQCLMFGDHTRRIYPVFVSLLSSKQAFLDRWSDTQAWPKPGLETSQESRRDVNHKNHHHPCLGLYVPCVMICANPSFRSGNLLLWVITGKAMCHASHSGKPNGNGYRNRCWKWKAIPVAIPF